MGKNEKKSYEFIVKGGSYYSSLAQPNTKGKFASNCYEVGIKNPTIVCRKSATKTEVEKINSIVNDYIKTIEDTADNFIKVKNSKYPIPTFENNGNRIELPRISNDTELIVKCKTNYSEQFSKDYITVIAVKLVEDYKPFNPFENIDDFEF